MSRLTYHQRIQLSFLVFIFLPIMAVSVASYLFIRESMMEKVQLSNDNFLNVINDQIARTIDDISFSSFYLLNDNGFKQLLSRFAETRRLDSFENHQIYNQINDNLSLISSKTLNHNIRMFIVNPQNFIVTSNSEGIRTVQSNLDSLLQEVNTAQPETLQWLGLFTDPSTSKSDYFIARVIQDPHQKEVVSVLLISISTAYFDRLLEPVQFGALALFDAEGNLISSRGDLSFNDNRQGDGYLRSEITLDKTNWQLVYETTQELLTGQISRTFYTGMTGILVLFLVFSISSIYIAKKLNTPIQKLQSVVRQFGKGNLHARLEVKGKDDMAELSHSINTMLYRLQKLVADIEQEKEQKKAMELEALFMQIQPHFLINTLNSIKCSLMLQKDHLHSGVLDSLMNLLRAYLKMNEPVTLQEECKLLRHYADIMQIRNEIQVDLQFELEPSTEQVIIPKLILQPLVENAIVHGLIDIAHPKLNVRTSCEGQDIVIEIEDNGEGMDQAQLQALNHYLQYDDPQQRSLFHRLGLINVLRRLRLTFGQAALLQLRSNGRGGITAAIRFPLPERELLAIGRLESHDA